MTVRKMILHRADRRALLMLGASLATLASGLASGPSQAQTAAARLAARINAPAPQRQAPTGAPLRSGTMREALSRQRATQSRTEQIRAYVLSAREAAVAANRATVTDGLSGGGLDPTGVISEAIAAAKAGDTARANQLLISAGAANDPTGLKTWEGAGLPSQTVADGRTQVTIDQTQERALLSWNSFNIGANTTLQFNQKSNGVAQPGWVAVNRVTNAVAPSQILGNLKADGTVVVLNQSGIIFGKNAQVNTHSLLASTLELGEAARFVSGSTGPTQATTVKERSDAYLENGLFLPGNGTASANGNLGAALLVSGMTQGNGTLFADTVEGGITVDQGAQISSETGGFVILAAPTIDNAGVLTTTEGQVSLQAGRAVNYAQSTGAASDIDPFVRGYKLNSYAYSGQADGTVTNSGLIDSSRGYISLGTGANGSIAQNGLLSTTTSVSRNGKISLTSGTITLGGSSNLAMASGIEMLADTNGETIPQGSANDPADFKASQLEIGTQILSTSPFLPVGGLVGTNISMGQNAVIVAPGANIAIGVVTVPETLVSAFAATNPGRIDIGSGAIIDVSGLKDVQLDASHNQIAITPVKRSELRDTPNYREVALDGNFSLNGATLYVDPRLSGVRDDGVAWVGSPLIEAGSLAAQISSTTAEFMTKGGSVSLAGSKLFQNFANASTATVTIARDATIDFSGGWVNYAAGTVKTSQLVTNDGRIVDIGKANPNDIYVGVADGFTEIQPRFGIVRTYYNAAAQGQSFDPSYDEGQDAGTLTIDARAVSIDGNLYGNAFAGSRQVNDGDRPSLVVTAGGRTLQRTAYELPSGGALSISSLGDMIVYHGTRGAAESDLSELLLDDAMLSGAGLSNLSLTAAGTVTFAGLNPVTLQSPEALTITEASDLDLAPGGALLVNAGRTIRFDGDIDVASGTITAQTELLGRSTTILGGGILSGDFSNGSVFRTGLYGSGNGDDISGNYLLAQDPGELNPFDIVVTGTLSTAGLWINDYAETGIKRGAAYADGGSISLTVAPRVFEAIGSDLASATQAIDLSGSIHVSGALKVGSGGYVNATGGLVLTGKGGDVSLINETVYASTRLTTSGLLDPTSKNSARPIEGTNQSVDFTPISGSTIGLGADDVLPALVPVPSSTVDIAAGSIQGFGFAGGGTLTLVAPDISFGSDDHAGSTHIGFDFFAKTGFATLNASTTRSRIVSDVFANDRVSDSAFLETTRFTVGAGETFDLTQWVLPSILTADLSKSLVGLASGADLTTQSFLTPIKPDQLWDQQAANLVLGGLTELDVLAGGRIVGSPEASITTAKLYNAGVIDLPGGSIAQQSELLDSLVVGGLGVHGAELGGLGLAEAFGGPVDAEGRFSESALNAAGVTTPGAAGAVLTNAALVTSEGADRLIYFLGLVNQSEGIVLDTGSVTDLSGIALVDPRAPLRASGERLRAGRLVDGGTLSTAALQRIPRITGAGTSTNFDTGRTLIRRDGATLDIGGANTVFDQAIGRGQYASYLEWSKAGTISALAGGSLGTTPIAARGGDDRAEGGTLEWLNPTIGAANGDGAIDYLSAGMIADSGFDSLIARGSLTLDGDFSLNLRKALMVTSQDPVTPGTLFDQDAFVTVSATAGSDATIGASYIRFASRRGTTSIGASLSGDGEAVFVAGDQGMDIVGGIGFTRSIASLTLGTTGDVRFTGVNDRVAGNLPQYNGQLIAGGDLTIDARRTYATTGTGNLQALLEGTPAAQLQSFDVVALDDHSVTFGNNFLDPAVTAPLSAGSHLRILAARIVQNGYLAAPLGLLELGSTTAQTVGIGGFQSTPTQSVTFGEGSVTTVSGAGLTIPYGTGTDAIEYYFPTLGTPITRVPTGQLNIGGGSIVETQGALIDGRGGGDVFNYEFQSGVGGSRDVLDRFNTDQYSSNGFDPVTGIGYQYADQRQVFALVPVSQLGNIAPFDPAYSADYGSAGPVDLYGADAGRTVTLDGGNGVPAGEYLLVPAKYAMSVPGALRLVENTDAVAPIPGTSSRLLDGSVVVGGTYGYAGNGISESTRRSFTVESKDVFGRYSKIETTSGSGYIADQATKAGLERPRLPIDAARVILAPLTELRVAGAFDTSAAGGGRGGEFDILGQNIVIAAAGEEATDGALLLTDSTLTKLNATSLLIGGQRVDNADGTTSINATAATVAVNTGAALSAPELLLAVAGTGSQLTIADGATLTATGDVGSQPSSDYIASTGGSLLRLATGTERLVQRTETDQSMLSIGAASITGGALTLDSSGTFAVSDNAAIDAKQIAISGGAIRFDGSTGTTDEAGVIGAALEAKLAAADRLTIRSSGALLFSAGGHRFNDLVLDSGTIASIAGTAAEGVVNIVANNVRLTNSAAAGDGCATAGICGAASTLTLDATTISFGANDVRALGFANGVMLGASDGMYVEGKGSFSTGSSALTLRTPFLVERAEAADPREQAVRPDYSFLTTGDFVMTASGTNAAAKPTGNTAPGARIGIGTIDARVRTASIEGSLIRATAGIIDIQSQTDIALTGASLQTPGYEMTFGDAVDPVLVSAGGGTINLLAANGNISADARSSFVSDSGVGKAGTLNLLASNGAITLDAAINTGVKGPRQGSFAFDSGTGAFDLSGFTSSYGTLFGGDFWVRSGAGNLDLAAGQTLKANAVTLTADGGAITIAGTIDTSGVDVTGLTADAARDAAVNGGDIALWGNAGVTLASTALLDTHTTGYAATDSRSASAGDVTIGIERADAAITIQNGAVIDAGARRTQAEPGVGRLVPQIITDPATGSPVTVYRYAEPDVGGTVLLRAPVIGADRDKVAVGLGGTILGADSVQLEGFQRYDLDALADSGQYSGVSRAADGTLILNFASSGANPFTGDFTLADGTPSLVNFIQNFGITTIDGSSLDGVRLRPGVELASTGAIKTETQWNLGAATFTPQQLQDAVAAGVLRVIPELGIGGQTQYAVIPGQEGALLDLYATFLYRVGGSARREAPVVTLRAGGDLTIDRSISDGFFTFRDKSDPAYLNYQLGGGDRAYSPALQFSCGGVYGTCDSIPDYASGVASNPGTTGTLIIGLNTAAAQGEQTNGAAYVNSPLAIQGNGAAGAVDANGDPTGDPLGFGELFPLLSGDVAMHSSDLRLVAGAGTKLSVNPLQVDRGLSADMTVSGNYTYRVRATGTVSYDGPLQFALLQPANSAKVDFDIGNTLDLADTTAGLDRLKYDAYTQLNWGATATGLSADARAAALTYFAGKGYTFTGSANSPSGIVAPLSDVVGFLQSFEPTYQAGLASGRQGYTDNRTVAVRQYGTNAQQTAADSPNLAQVRSYVRTGDGAIDVAASRDIDLRGAVDPVYRRQDGTLATQPSSAAAQIAASAIYTAGVRVAADNVSARINGGTLVSITPDSSYLLPSVEQVDFIPSPKAFSDTAPVLAHDGGDIVLDAGRDVLGRRNSWSELFRDGQVYTGAGGGMSTVPGATAGQVTQPWRTGSIGVDTEIGLSPRYFTSGVGALAGGDVTISAGRDISDLTVALDSGVTTRTTGAGAAMLTFGNGDLSVAAGRDILAGRFDIATGAASIHADGDIAALGTEPNTTTPQYLRVRLSDAVVDVSAMGAATLGSVSALGTDLSINSSSFFSPTASFGLTANGTTSIAQTAGVGDILPLKDYGQVPTFIGLGSITPSAYLQILPPTFQMTSLSASIDLPDGSRQLLYPSPLGQLRLFSAGDIDQLVIAMSDADPALVGGAFTAPRVTDGPPIIAFPFVTANTTDAQLREQHNQRITHAGDAEPVRIYSNGDIDQSALFLPKQARITAGGDIIDMFFNGQNVASTDVTRIRAGGDIIGTIGSRGLKPSVASNDFILGGPGALILEAGGDIGPFVTSANIVSIQEGPNQGVTFSYAGGIRTIGNDYNPWLPNTGADLSVRFGMAAGADYAALSDTYLNPENLANLDGDLFEQVTDSFGNTSPDRTKPIYAPLLAEWLRDNAPDSFAALFGGQSYPDTAAGNAALADAAYGRFADLYAVFTKIDPLRQQSFLINNLYFNELSQAAVVDGPSYLQYIRGYRAVQTLFPTSLGYTDNLAPYTLDPSTVSVDHPLGEPVRNIVDGQPQRADRVLTGNIDLRLATIQTGRGGDVTILGPGGDVIAGSVVRTSDQPQRRATSFAAPVVDRLEGIESGVLGGAYSNFTSVPLGYEGVLTLRGGQIKSFTDGDFILNQSRVFTQQGGDITMWSSNGDLNAGQGPKSASNFPPVTVRLDEDGLAEVNSAGSVSGAGIGTFQRFPDDPPSDVLLIAPVGEVDAGDAGVRASGNVVVAAARVANADNFSAAGDITGVPSSAVTASIATPANAASAIAAQAASAASAAADQGERRSLITVDVLGPATDPDPDCDKLERKDDLSCRRPEGQ